MDNKTVENTVGIISSILGIVHIVAGLLTGKPVGRKGQSFKKQSPTKKSNG